MSDASDYQTEFRALKASRPKCDRRSCNEPSTLRSVLCKAHLAEYEENRRVLNRLYAKFGAGNPTRIYTCPKCGDSTDDPHNLCKCPE